MLKVGDKIRIDYMEGEPQYTGKIGIVERVSVDPWGDTRADGTWGGCALYLNTDSYTILK